MLTVSGLRAGYRGRVVLDVPMLTLSPGTITAFLGPNGSGKSTLLRCAVGALPTIAGSISWDGTPLRTLRAAELARIVAYVPQETQFPFAFTVRELVRMGSDTAGELLPSPRGDAALDLFEMGPFADKSLTALSGGEQQRASLARAFAQNTRCLLLDEPTSHLDLRHQVRLADALRFAAHHEGKAVGVVLHDLNFAVSFVDEVVLLAEGNVVFSGVSRELTVQTISQVYRTAVAESWDTQTGSRWFVPVPSGETVP